MKTFNMYEEGEEVLIRAKVSRMYMDKGRILYVLKDSMGNDYPYKFKDADLMPIPIEEETEESDS